MFYYLFSHATLLFTCYKFYLIARKALGVQFRGHRAGFRLVVVNLLPAPSVENANVNLTSSRQFLSRMIKSVAVKYSLHISALTTVLLPMSSLLTKVRKFQVRAHEFSSHRPRACLWISPNGWEDALDRSCFRIAGCVLSRALAVQTFPTCDVALRLLSWLPLPSLNFVENWQQP